MAGVLSCINLSHACCCGGRGAWGGRRNRAEEESFGWPSIVSLDLEVSDLFGSQRSRTASPHNLRTPTPCPCTSLWGKWDFSQIDVELWMGPTQRRGHPGSLGGCLGLGKIGRSSFSGIRLPQEVAPFLRCCPPREMRAPPGRCPPRPTLSQSKRCAVSSCARLWCPRGRPVLRPTCELHAVRCLGCVFLGVFQPNRVRKVANMSLFWSAGLLYTRGWGLRPGGVLVGSLTCCRSYSCGGGSVPCLVVGRWALLSRVEYLC